MPTCARPLSLGLLRLRPGAPDPERQRARIALARRANVEGYAHVETLELMADAAFGRPRHRDVLNSLESIAQHIDAAAVLVAARPEMIDCDRVELIADRTRMIVLWLPPLPPS